MIHLLVAIEARIKSNLIIFRLSIEQTSRIRGADGQHIPAGTNGEYSGGPTPPARGVGAGESATTAWSTTTQWFQYHHNGPTAQRQHNPEQPGWGGQWSSCHGILRLRWPKSQWQTRWLFPQPSHRLCAPQRHLLQAQGAG